MHSDDDMPEGPSRSQRKREVEELQKLGEELAKLSPRQLETLPLPDILREAVAMAQRITSHGALRRQRQYIGRLMCDIDPEPIRSALAELRNADRASRARFQECERWRDRLLAQGDAALSEFLERYPAADRQHLRRLIREASQESAGGNPPRHARELFRYIQGLD